MMMMTKRLKMLIIASIGAPCLAGTSAHALAEQTLPTIPLTELADSAPKKTTLVLFTSSYCLTCAYEEQLLARRVAAYPQLRIMKFDGDQDSDTPRLLIRLPGYSDRDTGENIHVLLTEQNVDAFLSARVKAGEEFKAIARDMLALRAKSIAEVYAEPAMKLIQEQLQVLEAQEQAVYKVDAPALRRLENKEADREQPFRDRIVKIKGEMDVKVAQFEDQIDQQRAKARTVVQDLVLPYLTAYQHNDKDKMREISDRAYALTKPFRAREKELIHELIDVTEPFYRRIRAMNTEIDESPDPQESAQISALLEHRERLLASIKAHQKPLHERIQQAILAAYAKSAAMRTRLVEFARSDERAAQKGN